MRDAVATSDSFVFAPPKQRAPGQEPIPGYPLVEFLGRGGFGEVWKCEAPGGLFKAIKFVHGNLSGLDADSAGARQELDALQRIKAIRHPFILSLDRVEIVNGELVVVMELADRSLQDRFVECQALGEPGVPRDELLGYLMEAAEALDVMNLRHGLLHLDIKPGNLFLIADHVKVADFGLVNRVGDGQTAEGPGLGGITPLYSAPETILGKLSAQSDQYSLAVVYQHLLTGKPPFDGKNMRQLALQHVKQPPKLDAVPETDRPLLERALAKKPEERFPSCLEFVHGLMLAGAGSVFARRKLETGSRDTSRILRYTLDDVAGKPKSGALRAGASSSRLSSETPVALPRTAETLPDRIPSTTSSPVPPGYKFLALVDQTPLGEVWKVEAPDGRPRRLRLLPDVAERSPARQRDALEQLSSISHPALPAVEVLEIEGGRLVLITDVFEQTVVDRCRICQAQRLPGIPRPELLGYLWTAAEALDYLHNEEGIYHLALTPNALILAGASLLVADAGLAEVFGLEGFVRSSQTARYAAPELHEGRISAACDQYSLALMYCEMVMGLHPFRGQSLQRLNKARTRPRPALDLLAAADRLIIGRALHIEPERRYPSCGQFMQALETGEAERLTGKSQPFVSLPDASADSSNALLGGDPARALDRLHRLLAELGGDPAVAPVLSGTAASPRAGVERRFGARVYGSTTRIKLEGFRQQWGAQTIHVEPANIVFALPIGQSFWRRCLGKGRPELEVTFHFNQPQAIGSQLTEVIVKVRPVNCNAEEGTRLLNEAAPLILDSAGSYLQATPERRGQDRLRFDGPVQITPLFPGQAVGPALKCIGKDISMRGIGFLATVDPPANQILVALSGRDAQEPIVLPAEVVRVHRRGDGQREVGARFAFGGFDAPLS